jgi:hypothetical protein
MKRNKINTISGFSNIEVESFMKAMLATDDRWAIRALLVVYSFQTPSERKNHISIEENVSGFSKFDAQCLTRLAIKAKRGSKLSTDEIKKLKTIMPKYAVQVANASDKEKLIKHLQRYYCLPLEEGDGVI